MQTNTGKSPPALITTGAHRVIALIPPSVRRPHPLKIRFRILQRRSGSKSHQCTKPLTACRKMTFRRAHKQLDFGLKQGKIMHNRIYTLTEKHPISISNGENGDLDGDFDGIAWRDIKMLGNGLVDTLTSMGLMEADEYYLKTSLCRYSLGMALYPAVKISTTRAIPDHLREKINTVCFKYAQGLISKASHATGKVLLDDSRQQVPLTTEEEKKTNRIRAEDVTFSPSPTQTPRNNRRS